MAGAATVNDVLDGQVGLDVECLDRIYLNGYVPNLQVGGQVVSFMTRIWAVRSRRRRSWRRSASRSVRRWIVSLKTTISRWCGSAADDRKVEVMRRYLVRQGATGRAGVAAIGMAQEFQNVFAATNVSAATGFRGFRFSRPIGG